MGDELVMLHDPNSCFLDFSSSSTNFMIARTCSGSTDDGSDGIYFDVGDELVMLHELHKALDQEIQESDFEEKSDHLRRKDIKRIRKEAKKKTSAVLSQSKQSGLK